MTPPKCSRMVKNAKKLSKEHPRKLLGRPKDAPRAFQMHPETFQNEIYPKISKNVPKKRFQIEPKSIKNHKKSKIS